MIVDARACGSKPSEIGNVYNHRVDTNSKDEDDDDDDDDVRSVKC